MASSNQELVDRDFGFSIRCRGGEWEIIEDDALTIPTADHVTSLFHPRLGVGIRVRVFKRQGLSMGRAMARLCAGYGTTPARAARSVEEVEGGLERQGAQFSSAEPGGFESRVEARLLRRDSWFYELKAIFRLPTDLQERREILDAVQRGFDSFELDLTTEPKGRLPELLELDLAHDAHRDARRFVHLGHRVAIDTPNGWRAIEPDLFADRWSRVRYRAENGTGEVEIAFAAVHPADVPAIREQMVREHGVCSAELSQQLAAAIGLDCVGTWILARDLEVDRDFETIQALLHFGATSLDLRLENHTSSDLGILEDELQRFALAITPLSDVAISAARDEHSALLLSSDDWDPEDDLGADWSLRRGVFRDDLSGFMLKRPADDLEHRLEVEAGYVGEGYTLRVIAASRGSVANLRAIESPLGPAAFHIQRAQQETVADIEVETVEISGREMQFTTVDAGDGSDADEVPQRTVLASAVLEEGLYLTLEMRGPRRLLEDHPGALVEIASWLRFDLGPSSSTIETDRGWLLPHFGLALEVAEDWFPKREGSAVDEWCGIFLFERDSVVMAVELNYIVSIQSQRRRPYQAQRREALLRVPGRSSLPVESEAPTATILGCCVRGASYWYDDRGDLAEQGRVTFFDRWLGRLYVSLRIWESGVVRDGALPVDTKIFGGIRQI